MTELGVSALLVVVFVTVLAVAARSGGSRIARQADIFRSTSTSSSTPVTSVPQRAYSVHEGTVRLLAAIQARNVSHLRDLLATGISVNGNFSGWTPLKFAVYYGQVEVTRLLLQHGADLASKVGLGFYHAIHDAAARGHPYVTQLLLEHGGHCEDHDVFGRTPMHVAAERNHVSVVRMLLKYGCDVNGRDYGGSTPLHDAARAGRENVISLLISAGARVNEKNDLGDTPLHIAAYRTNVNVIRNLLVAGAEVNEKNTIDGTPLHYAALFGRVDEIRTLLEAGASINEKNKLGDTPLKIAILKSQPAAADALRARGGS